MAYFFHDYVFAAKYPFSSRAREIMRGISPEIGDLLAEKGFERLSAALKGQSGKKVFLHENDAVEEIMAYAAARMILSHMRNRFLANKYAVSEAKRASAYLAEEKDENISELAKDFGIALFHPGNGKLAVDIADFLMFAPKDVHYKLVSRELGNGRVLINEKERNRLIEEAVKKHVEKIPEAQAIPPAIKKAAERLQALLPKIEPQKISFREGENPLCVETILEMFKKHENVGHTGRWLLAVYLINRGMGTEDMLKIFSNAPDYNEKIAAYQIEHARKRGYKMPNCSSVIGYGYCVADCRITNPLNWRKKTGKG